MHFFLSKIILNTDFYQTEPISVAHANTTAGLMAATHDDQYYDTDGVADVIFFTLVFYAFDLIRPVYVFLLSALMVIIQCSFIIVHSTSAIPASNQQYHRDFQNYSQVFVFEFSAILS
jgi:hypothetical protein